VSTDAGSSWVRIKRISFSTSISLSVVDVPLVLFNDIFIKRLTDGKVSVFDMIALYVFVRLVVG
jgi:hypothetical protein